MAWKIINHPQSGCSKIVYIKLVQAVTSRLIKLEFRFFFFSLFDQTESSEIIFPSFSTFFSAYIMTHIEVNQDEHYQRQIPMILEAIFESYLLHCDFVRWDFIWAKRFSTKVHPYWFRCCISAIVQFQKKHHFLAKLSQMKFFLNSEAFGCYRLKIYQLRSPRRVRRMDHQKKDL